MSPTKSYFETVEVINDDVDNVKAYFRCGQAHTGMQDYEDAVSCFSKVKGLEPTNKAAQKELQVARNKIKAHREREKRLYASMFASDTKENRPEELTSESTEMES